MRNRLQTAGMGLGLVRLLQNAGRTEEARTTLASLEDGFQGIAEELGKPETLPSKPLARCPTRFLVPDPECEARLCATTNGGRLLDSRKASSEISGLCR